MDFNEYQEAAARTLNSEMGIKDALCMASMGLAGETGEVVDYIKKGLFHGHELEVVVAGKELGDILWYVAAVATILGLKLDEVANWNIDKLKVRYPHGFSIEASKVRVDVGGK